MAVDARHVEFEKNVKQWLRCRNCVEGEDAVKAAGPAYLPELVDQSPSEYQAYRDRASFYGASGRTVKGLSGTVMRKAPQIEASDKVKETTLRYLGEAGESVELIAQQIMEEVLGVSRVGMLVDAPEDENGDPYVVQYYAENVINWREEMIVRDTVSKLEPVLVVLYEDLNEPDDDGFGTHKVEQIRVLKLEDQDGTRVYTQEIWQKETQKKNGKDVDEWVKKKSLTPTMRGGKTADFIPFQFCNPSGIGAETEKSPILDLVNLNLSHYRNSADLEHGRHFTGLPTLYLAGFDPDDTKVKIGSSKAWVSDNVQAQAKYVEFTGQGLGCLERALEDKEKKMAVLGARLLEEAQPNETATAVNLRQAGERSVLATVADTVSEAVTNIMRWVGKWGNYAGSEKWSIQLNKDYDLTGMDAPTLTALMGAMQGGALSFEAYYAKLERAEMYPDGWTMEKEAEAIAAGMPLSPAGEVDQASAETSLQQQKDMAKKMKTAPLPGQGSDPNNPDNPNKPPVNPPPNNASASAA